MNKPITIIGSGFAAYQLVKTLRRMDSNVAITVITADKGHDYNKPDLSHVFSKKQSVADVITIHADDFKQQFNVELFAEHHVTNIDTNKQIITANNQSFEYQKLVFATGATPFVPPITGMHDGLALTLNSLNDFEQNQQHIQNAKSVLVIGGGLIGVEVALDLANAGKKVTLVEPNSQLMQIQLPEYVAQKLTQALELKTIKVYTATGVSTIAQTDYGVVATLTSGEQIEIEQILVCAGLKPNINLAQRANLEVNRGICVNEFMQTSNANIYALGDCAEFEGQVKAYLQPTLISAAALGKTLLGEATKVTLLNMMVKVKTPNYPIQIGGKTDSSSVSRWNLDVQSQGIVAKGYDSADNMVGFVVTRDCTQQAFSLLRQL
ncbi:NADH:flavorubredoxin reductase NorW [Shewanella sp. 3_MG-2023]|uniref:NADH:flavorubredoxin reductase NorW n=2 Tax=unclassified Shewanella TaxID=196818 RepID=UPI0026E1BBD1|nr:NADH:flavorubredoxin reductase NorW [Shewanella sp. 3_MG-2023]MDO6775964.1 NADH:flavorubredoxin reductase NorW [Shewanella sp. 3_MG-2023]